MGLGFLAALLALGAIRELIGQGSLGADLHLVFGESLRGAGWRVFDRDHGLLIALLPPGAFVLLGLMLALGNARSASKRATVEAVPSAEEPGFPA